MNNHYRKVVALFVAIVVALAGPVSSYAQSTNACTNAGVVFGFFNGVQTTRTQADNSLQILKLLYGTQIPSTGETISYQGFYNYTQGFEDFVETFDQRLREQNAVLADRYELFLEVINNEGPWWRNIVNTITATASIFDALREDLRDQITQKLTTLLGNPPTTINYAEHRLLIDSFALEGKKMVFFAHSQGNLFVNPAADYARSKTSADSVKVVHVAPASPSLRGGYVLADLDLVINGLRLAGGAVPPITDSIPGYLLRPAGSDGSTDILGHGLIAIYVNQSLGISSRVGSLVNAALASVKAPEQQAASGFFTATLSWDGAGDVDLHAFEPGGSHVFYSAKVGAAGFLDVDNVVANGPEHYFVSCDSTKLQTGTYQIAIANYARATGRTATVQISSSRNGVLGTKSLVLAGPTGSVPTYNLFSVQVTKDTQTGRFTAALQ